MSITGSFHVQGLKGSSGSIGAMELHSYCKDEENSYDSDHEYITSLKSITAIFSKTRLHLLNYIDNSGPKNFNRIEK